MTSWPSLQTDLRNAGAEWTDDEVVIDGRLITSRHPGDLPAFNDAMLKVFGIDSQAPTADRRPDACRRRFGRWIKLGHAFAVVGMHPIFLRAPRHWRRACRGRLAAAGSVSQRKQILGGSDGNNKRTCE